MSRNKGTFNFAANFEVLAKAPLDARMLVNTHADLTQSSTWQDGDGNIWLFDGAIVSVSNDPTPNKNGIYYLKNSASFNDPDNWVMAGKDTSINAYNVGDGSAGVFVGLDSSGNLKFRTISGAGAAVVSEVGDQIIISLDASFAGEVNSGQNIGTGDASIYSGKTGSLLDFRQLKGTNNILISVSEGSNSIIIDTSSNFQDIFNLINTKLDVSGGTITGDLNIDGSLYVNGTVSFNDNVYIKNNLFLDGSLYVRSMESIDVSSAFLTLNSGMVGTPPLWMQAGIIVDRGDEDPYVFLYDETNKTFRIGIATPLAGTLFEDASLMVVATREDSPIANGLAIWNDVAKRFDTSTSLTFDQTGLYIDSDVKIVKLAGAGVLFVTIQPDGTLSTIDLPSYVQEASLGNSFKWDSSGNLQVDVSVTGTGKYDTTLSNSLTMPQTVGGYPAGTLVSDLKGDTLITMFDNLLFPTVNPTYVNPSHTFTCTQPILNEIGEVSNIDFTSIFNRGAINIAGNFQDYRSGLANTYVYTDPSADTLLVNTPSTSSSDAQSIFGYVITIGSQTFANVVSYSQGPQPYDNKGVAVGSPLLAGNTPSVSIILEGVYPLFATTSTIAVLTKQTLVSMLSGNNIAFNMAPESSGLKQTFSIADAWTGAPTNRPIVGIQTFNTVSNQWEYQGGSAVNSLTYWTITATTQTVQGATISYKNYEYNGTDRSSISIRLVF